METETVHFKTETENGVVTRVGRSVVTQPKTEFKGGSVPWFDDSRLLKSNRTESILKRA